jgi:sec-independent protein translocase protein TatB
MFDVASPELLLVAVVAIVVIGPKDLPKAMRVVGYWVGKARGTMRQFRAGFDAMVREAELAEMEKKWAEENKRIMAQHPSDEAERPALPAPEDVAPEAVADDGPVPEMTEKPAIHDEPELPLAPAPETRAP